MSSPVHYPSDASSHLSRASRDTRVPSSFISQSSLQRGRRPLLSRPDLAGVRRVPVVEPASGDVAVERQISSDIPQESGLGEIVSQAHIWGTTINVDICTKEFTDFFKEFKDPGSEDPKYPLLLHDIQSKQMCNLNLDCRNLYSFNEELYQHLIDFPQEVLPIFDKVIGKEYIAEYAGDEDPEREAQQMQVKPFNLISTKSMRNIDPEDIDRLVSLNAMVVRVSSIIPDIQVAFFRCAHCRNNHTVEIDRGRIDQPKQCPNTDCRARDSLELIHNRCIFGDKQLVRVQETPDAIPEGETPQTVDIFAYADLVDVSKPGDRVTITGVYRAVPVRVNPRKRNVRSVYQSFIDALHFQKSSNRRLIAEDSRVETQSEFYTSFEESDSIEKQTNAREEKLRELARDPNIYDKLTNSLAPSIWEMEDVKKGLLCQLFGGTNKTFSQSSSGRFRGEINILLCGDPGTSKSQLLQYVHKIAPRGIYTSGKGSSAVGLTAYITKDPETKEMILESGALVLSDRGICCIDEFDKMSDSARSILHEVMEQQTISVAKAGIICSLNARTSILAAANPKESRYDVNMSVVENILLPPTLLSRFDLIYLILDKPNERLDQRLAQHLVSLYYSERDPPKDAVMDVETLTQFISLSRREIHPKLTNEAADALIQGYTELRKSGRNYNKKIITATPRQLESLIRTSEALAKMKFSQEVTKAEVDEAIRLMRVATQSAATDPKTGVINMDLITTGQTAFVRQELDLQMNALIDILDDLGTPKHTFSFLMQEFNKQSSQKLTLAQFKDLIAVLEQREIIRIGSWAKGDPVCTRIEG